MVSCGLAELGLEKWIGESFSFHLLHVLPVLEVHCTVLHCTALHYTARESEEVFEFLGVRVYHCFFGGALGGVELGRRFGRPAEAQSLTTVIANSEQRVVLAPSATQDLWRSFWLV